MGGALARYAFHACIAQRWQVQALEQGFAAAQQHRAHREMKFVDSVAIPLYVVLGPDESVLGVKGDWMAPEAFAGFLQDALGRYETPAKPDPAARL